MIEMMATMARGMGYTLVVEKMLRHCYNRGSFKFVSTTVRKFKTSPFYQCNLLLRNKVNFANGLIQ